MNSIDLSLGLIAEIVIPFLVLSIVLILTITSGRKKFKKAAKLLILNVKSGEDEDKEAVSSFLINKLKIDQTAAKKITKKIINERKFLIRNLVAGILDKNFEAIGELNHDLRRISAHYHQLEISVAEPEPEAADEDDLSSTAKEKELKLEKEVKNLKQELHITLTTLNNIYREFSSMFGNDDASDEKMTVEQIVNAMESFSNRAADSSESSDGDELVEQLSEENTFVPPTIDDDDALEEDLIGLVSGDIEEDTLADQLSESMDDIPVSDLKPTEIRDEMPSTDSIEKDLNNDSDSDSDSASDSDSDSDSDSASDSASDSTSAEDDIDFSVDSAIDEIDSALDELELGESDGDEPDWGDAFAESGDKMGSGD